MSNEPQSIVYKKAGRIPPTFLLAPPPQSRSRLLNAYTPPTPPATRSKANRSRSYTAISSPRSPLSPRDSNLDQHASPALSSADPFADAISDSLKNFGYSDAFGSDENLLASPRIPPPKSRSKSITHLPQTVLANMPLLSRGHSKSSSAQPKMPLMQRSNMFSNDVPVPPLPSFERRGSAPSVPTYSSENLGRSHHHREPSSHKQAQKAAEERRKRYPLPMPFSSVVEMDQMLGDTRNGGAAVDAFVTAPRATTGNSRGRTAVPIPRKMHDMGIGIGEMAVLEPHISADGRMWRDKEEEQEYAGLLSPRRPSGQSMDDDEAQWHARLPKPSKPSRNQYQPVVVAPVSPPHSATSSSEEEECWSPLVETHPAQHHFPSYVFPAGPMPRSSSNTAARDRRRRPAPLHRSSNDDTRLPPPPTVPQADPALRRAKDDFFASSFAPSVPASATAIARKESSQAPRSKPPTTGPRQAVRRSSVQGFAGESQTIAFPPPGLGPAHHIGAPPSHHPPRPSTRASDRSEDSVSVKKGLLGVFRRK